MKVDAAVVAWPGDIDLAPDAMHRERARYFELASLHQMQDDPFAVESLPGKNYPTAAELSARNWQLISDDDCVQKINENYFNITIVKEVLNLVGKHPRFNGEHKAIAWLAYRPD